MKVWQFLEFITLDAGFGNSRRLVPNLFQKACPKARKYFHHTVVECSFLYQDIRKILGGMKVSYPSPIFVRITPVRQMENSRSPFDILQVHKHLMKSAFTYILKSHVQLTHRSLDFLLRLLDSKMEKIKRTL